MVRFKKKSVESAPPVVDLPRINDGAVEDFDNSISTLGAFVPGQDTLYEMAPSSPQRYTGTTSSSLYGGSNKQLSFKTHSSCVSENFSERVDQELSLDQFPRGHTLSSSASTGMSLESSSPTSQRRTASQELYWPNRLIGRNHQVQVLEETFYWTVERDCRALVNITGESGSGKSYLASSLTKKVTDFGGLVVTSKFDLHSNVPCSALMQAFASIVQQLVERAVTCQGDNDRARRRIQDLRQAIQPWREALQFIVPNLEKLFTFDSNKTDGKVATEQEDLVSYGGESSQTVLVDGRHAVVHFAVREFMRNIASDDHPIVIIINDMQNSDQVTLGLLDHLLADQQGGSLLLVTTTREEDQDSNNANAEHSVSNNLHAWNELLAQVIRADVLLQQLHLDPLSVEAVEEIITVSLALPDIPPPLFEGRRMPPPPPVKPLAELVHKKTHGNAFFVLQFLQSLLDQKLLKCQVRKWDIDQIQSTQQATLNVAELMMKKLYRYLDNNGRVCLSVAAHLGPSFATNVLEVAYLDTNTTDKAQLERDRESLHRRLLQCVSAGLLEYDDRQHRYFFVHDQVQDAARRILDSPSDASSLPRHLQLPQIGRRLLKHYQTNEPLEECLFVGVDLCLAGLGESTVATAADSTEDSKAKLAPFLQQAGDLAMKKAAFPEALHYYEAGLTCLIHKSWESDQRIFLALTSGAAEAAHCSANHASLEKHLASILGRDISLNDKMRAYMMRIKSYGEKEQFHLAIETAVEIYNQLGLGTSLTTNPGKVNVVMELLKTKSVLKKHNQDSLIGLPLMVDKRRIAAMGIIDMLAVPAYSAAPMLYVLIWIRAVRWSVKFGVCKYSATAFSRFSVVVGAVLKKTQDAFMYAQVALALAERLGARDTLPKTICGVYAFTLHWTSDWRSTLNPLMYGYQVGMQTGDVEYAFHSLVHYNVAAWLTASQSLEQSIADLEEHCQLMLRYNQKAMYTVTSILLHMGKNLLGQSHDPLTFSFKLQDNAETPDSGLFVLAHRTMKLAMMQVCYIFGDYKEALRHASESADVGTKVAQGYLFVARHRFLHGLISVANRKVNFAKTVVNTLDRWIEEGKSDCKHYSELLQAEIASAQGRAGKAIEMYNAAQASAERCEFVHDQALVHERAGLFYLGLQNAEYTSLHLGLAVALYRKWGAQAKVQQLTDTHGDLIPTSPIGSEIRIGT